MFGQGLVWDSSGNSMLTGTWYFRQAAWVPNSSAAYALFGSITFSNGTYTMNTPTYLEAGQGSEVENSITGGYAIGAGGFGYLTDVLGNTGAQIRGMVANGVFIGSDTEGGYNSLFVMAQIPTPTPTLSTFNGSYSMAYFNYPSPLDGYPYDAQFTLNPNGAGALGTVAASGYYYALDSSGNSGTTSVTQNASAKYTVSSGAVVITFPNLSNSTSLLSGQDYLYFSPDGNFVFGGSPTQADFVVGVKGGGAAPVLGSNLLYNAGVYVDVGNSDFDTYYGSLGLNSGSVIEHSRIFSAGAGAAYSSVTAGTVPTTPGATYNDPFDNYTIGDNGNVRIGFGSAPFPGIDIALGAPTFSGGGVYLNPTGVVNAASYAPFTSGLSPGELLVMTGTNLAPNATIGKADLAQGTPFPTTLNGVEVLIDGIPAPLYYVSATQCAAIVPYASTEFTFASIQVNNNGSLSNKVTEFLDNTTSPTTPGVFTNPADGLGYAAALHADYTLITNNSPAQPGEAISVYMTGLGAVFPPITDGSAGSSTSLNFTVQTITAAVDDTVNAVAPATVGFAGLAPGYAGLYQVNLTVPSGVNAGDDYLVIEGPDTYSEEALIPIGSGGTPGAVPVRTEEQNSKTYKSTKHRRPQPNQKPVFKQTAKP